MGKRVVENAMARMMMKSQTKISKTSFKKKKGAKSSTRKRMIMGVEDIKTVSSQSGIQRFLARGRGLIGTEIDDNWFGERADSQGNLLNVHKNQMSV